MAKDGTVVVTQAARKPPTLAELAKAAGVSKGTASNVFNRPMVVRAEVRERVLGAARAIGYRGPDPMGRMLSAGKVNAIGVATVLPLAYFFEDPFARSLMSGVTEVCDARGVGLSLVSAGNDEALAWNVRSAVVDGLILFCIDGADRLIVAARERKLPFVALTLTSRDTEMSAVGIDNIEGARQAAAHLLGLGHRRFVVLAMRFAEGGHGRATAERIAASVYSASGERLAGYLEALEGVGIDPATVPVFETQSDVATISPALEELFAAPQPPTAILAQSDRIALIAIDWLRARGLRVPRDVSIVGFDGIPEGSTSSPPLTTIAQPISEIGRRAVVAILDHDGEVWREKIPVKLLVRGSTGPVS